jgi:hypothetical protein
MFTVQDDKGTPFYDIINQPGAGFVAVIKYVYTKEVQFI